MKAARELGINRIYPVARASSPCLQNSWARRPCYGAPLGFIVTGMAGPYLEHVLADLGLSGVFPILTWA